MLTRMHLRRKRRSATVEPERVQRLPSLDFSTGLPVGLGNPSRRVSAATGFDRRVLSRGTRRRHPHHDMFRGSHVLERHREPTPVDRPNRHPAATREQWAKLTVSPLFEPQGRKGRRPTDRNKSKPVNNLRRSCISDREPSSRPCSRERHKTARPATGRRRPLRLPPSMRRRPTYQRHRRSSREPARRPWRSRPLSLRLRRR
jgi:hypothetical protein